MVEFGKTNMQDHPEVSIAGPSRVNEMILTFIDKFRLINDQLVRQSYKLPLPAGGVQFYSSRARNGGGAIKSGDLRRTVSLSSSSSSSLSSASSALVGGQPLTPEARVASELLASQQPATKLMDMESMMALASAVTSLPHSGPIQDESNENGAGEPAADDSNIDEASAAPDGAGMIDESTPSDEDEADEAAEEDGPCKNDDCTEFVNGPANSNTMEQSAGVFSDEHLNRLQHFSHPPPAATDDDQQQQQSQQHKDYEPTSQRPLSTRPIRIPIKTVGWTVYDHTLAGQESSAAPLTCSLLMPMLVLLTASSAWLSSANRRVHL